MLEYPKGNGKNQTGSATLQQRLVLEAEVRIFIKLIEVGLRQLQRISGANSFYHLLMLTITSRSERLVKTILCLYIFREASQFPNKRNRKAFPTSGAKEHNLLLLLDKITKKCFAKKYVEERRGDSDDIMYLCEDTQLRELAKVLSGFAQAARYHNLDVVSGDEPETLSPEWYWDQVERMVVQELVMRLERLARTLVRLFTIGGLGSEASQFTGLLRPSCFCEMMA